MKRSAAILIVAFALTSTPASVPSPAAAATRIPGMDISEYQGNINWDMVGKSDVRFIFMRATKGLTYDDAKYAAYRVGAAAQNIKWTAYHYAVPNGKQGNAVAQANHFADVAQLAPGNILPVLDIEQAGGLGRERLQDWVAQWLNRVYHRTGAKPLIYTSPSFWRSTLGNTQRFANHGYQLWIAHWGVHAPDVPAGNWAGHGWSFWQWTNCGSVAGITGCVDKDRYRGTHIGRLVTIH
jgi:GH25 family lysozyme M1 (1,4-beta-N-acetylmuramidase)